jgi:hypothetical protein
MRSRMVRSSVPAVAAAHACTTVIAFNDDAARYAIAKALRRWRACPTGPDSIRRCVRDWRRLDVGR